MDEINEIFKEYVRMRTNGLGPDRTLRALHHYIEILTGQQREALADYLRVWEAGKAGTKVLDTAPHGAAEAEAQSNPDATVRIEVDPKAAPDATAADEQAEITWVRCPHCGKANQRHEIFCHNCGQLLESEIGGIGTRTFPSSTSERSDYFGAESVLVLAPRGMAKTREVRPQRYRGEVIVGRSSSDSAMIPDIDLAEANADELGVSRVHLALRYDAENNAISVHDLGSVNGSYINGQEIFPHEVRTLSDGDELRLGHLVMRVYFRHPPRMV